MISFLFWIIAIIVIVHLYNTKHIVVETNRTNVTIKLIWWKNDN